MTARAYANLLDLYRGLPPGALSETDWDGVVRVARSAGVLARLASLFHERGEGDQAPAPVRPVLAAELRLAEAHARNVRWEVRRIQEALGQAGVPFLLLKGAAYVIGDLPAARGRLFEDVDLLVPRQRLGEVESALQLHGWVGQHRHPYDQRYYRRWMHQIPPMRHSRRGTTVDVHHNLLPDTAPLSPDSELLWAEGRDLSNWPGVRLPAEEDLVLHSAAHLFFDGAMENGLRDLMDLDALIRRSAAQEAFWPRLLARARAMDLVRPLDDALRWCRCLLATPVPAEGLPDPREVGRSRLRRVWLDGLYRQGLRPDHPLAREPLTRTAHGLLYLRSHALRMPPRLLVPHLMRKGFRRREEPT